LPAAGDEPRRRPKPLKDADLPELRDAVDLCLSEMEEITDVGLSHLTRMNKLERLWLDDLCLTDAGIEHIAGLTGMKRLSLGLVRHQRDGGKGVITDVGLACLTGLRGLERLHVASHGIADAGLEHLKALKTVKSLRSLSIASSGITREKVVE